MRTWPEHALALAVRMSLRQTRAASTSRMGGISPGTLHAHGKLVKVHQVHYSVGRARQYLLYVGIPKSDSAAARVAI